MLHCVALPWDNENWVPPRCWRGAGGWRLGSLRWSGSGGRARTTSNGRRVPPLPRRLQVSV